MLSDSKHIWYCLRSALPNYSNGLFESLDTLSDTNMLDSLHLDISTYSDIIDQPQATKPTIHVNKKQKVAKKKASQMPYNIKYKLSISEV
jgi:hypothetical protein